MIDFAEYRCKQCGGELNMTSEGHYQCPYCDSIYEKTTAVNHIKELKKFLDDAKYEVVCNLRRNLYDAVNEEYISNQKIRKICEELKKYIPTDFAADFYYVATGNNLKALTKHIRTIDVEANYDEIESVIKFLIKSLQTEYLLELNNLIDRAYKEKNLVLFEKYSTELSIEARKVEAGVYETKIPRDVFVAYSSKDMDKVSELVELLEEQGLRCFVAARNLRHGKGSVENYNRLLQEAMDYCKSFVFVSSLHSRSLNCDALEIEIPYIRTKDIENAPSGYKNNYATLPHRYKKPRVEYRVEESHGFNAADAVTNDFFDGYERVYTPESVAERVIQQLVVESTPIVATNRFDVESKLQQAQKHLNAKQWNLAIQACDNAIELDETNAQAYWYRLFAQLKITDEDQLSTLNHTFDHLLSYKKLMAYADPATVSRLQHYNSELKAKKEAKAQNDKKVQQIKQQERQLIHDFENKNPVFTFFRRLDWITFAIFAIGIIYAMIDCKLFVEFDLLNIFKYISFMMTLQWFRLINVFADVAMNITVQSQIKKRHYDLLLIYQYLLTDQKKAESDFVNANWEVMLMKQSSQGKIVCIAKYLIRVASIGNIVLFGYAFINGVMEQIIELRVLGMDYFSNISEIDFLQLLEDMFLNTYSMLFIVIGITLKILNSIVKKKYKLMKKNFSMESITRSE